MAAADRRRSNFTYATQNKIFDAYNAECFYCHKSLVLSNRHKGERGAWNADHLIPAAKGGNNSLENGVAACWNCKIRRNFVPCRYKNPWICQKWKMVFVVCSGIA